MATSPIVSAEPTLSVIPTPSETFRQRWQQRGGYVYSIFGLLVATVVLLSVILLVIGVWFVMWLVLHSLVG